MPRPSTCAGHPSVFRASSKAILRFVISEAGFPHAPSSTFLRVSEYVDSGVRRKRVPNTPPSAPLVSRLANDRPSLSPPPAIRRGRVRVEGKSPSNLCTVVSKADKGGETPKPCPPASIPAEKGSQHDSGGWQVTHLEQLSHLSLSALLPLSLQSRCQH